MIFWERQKSLTAFYEACTKPVRDAYDLTQMQFNILMFLHNNPQFDTAGESKRATSQNRTFQQR